MSSSVSKKNRNYLEHKKNPITRLYTLVFSKENNVCYSLLNQSEWIFIDEGIFNPSVKNSLHSKDIYLENIFTNEQLLLLTSQQRATLLSQQRATLLSQQIITFFNFFNSLSDFKKYCSKNRIEIIDTFQCN